MVSMLYSDLGYTHFTNMWFTHQGPIFPPSSTPLGFPDSSVGKELLQCRRLQFDSWVGKIRWRRDRLPTPVFLGFTCSSAGKEYPACERPGFDSFGWEDPLEKGKATHSTILAWKIPWTFQGVAKSQTWLSDFHFTSLLHYWPETPRLLV